MYCRCSFTWNIRQKHALDEAHLEKAHAEEQEEESKRERVGLAIDSCIMLLPGVLRTLAAEGERERAEQPAGAAPKQAPRAAGHCWKHRL